MSAAAVLAVDVGGTTIKAAVADRAGSLLHERSRPTPAANGPDAVIAAVIELIAELRADREVGAVGIAVPGEVDAEAGVAVFSANLGFRGCRCGRSWSRPSGCRCCSSTTCAPRAWPSANSA